MLMAAMLMVAGSSTVKNDAVEIEESSSKEDVKQNQTKLPQDKGIKRGNKTK